MKFRRTTNNPEQTQKIAVKFLDELKGGEVVALKGDLGSGKTTFVQGLARALGVKKPVRSPTYTLMNTYETTDETIRTLVHLDLYRISTRISAKELELEQWLDRDDVVVVIEWPERFVDLVPDYTARFTLGKKPQQRNIEIRDASGG